MNKLIRAKFKAAGIHFTISLLVFIGILFFIFFQWYPDIFFEAEGGWAGIKIMAAVDLILGPSLTFIIYNHLKKTKEIVFDLSVVVLIQLSALIWGGMQVYSSRPVALVMWDGIFYTVTEDYYNKQGVDLDRVEAFSDDKPLVIFAESAKSLEDLEELQRLNQDKIPPYAQVHLYRPVSENIENVISHKISADTWAEYLPDDAFDTDYNVFLGKAKYRDFLIYLDDDANLVELRLR